MKFKPTSGLIAAAPKVTGEPPPDTEAPAPPPPIQVEQDDAFLHLMDDNLKQGRKLAQIQVANGKRPNVRQLAERIVQNHNEQLDRLKRTKGS
jgi:uncharacterized protein (DUF305 family)